MDVQDDSKICSNQRVFISLRFLALFAKPVDMNILKAKIREILAWCKRGAELEKQAVWGGVQ